MTPRSAVDFICDSRVGAVVDDLWTAAAVADGIGHVRTAVQANPQGIVHWPLVEQGAAAWKQAGVTVDGVFAFEYLPPFQDQQGVWHYPNEPVGDGTHRLTSAYIERFRLQIEAHAPALLAAGMGGFTAWNEPQVALVWPAGRFAQAVKVLRMIMAAHGDTGAIIVGEHGVTNAALPAQEAAYVATYQEMAGAVEDAHFFQHFGASPYLGAPLLYGNYGAIQYRVNPPALVPGADYKLAPVVRRMFGKT